MSKSYSELIKLKTFEERFLYLQTNSIVGKQTFGKNRFVNQMLYSSAEWKRIRDKVILRDCGCDLGIEDRPIIKEPVVIHHINPITLDDLTNCDKKVFDLENLITIADSTHRQLHYGSVEKLYPSKPVERKPNDTCPWKGGST